MEENQTKMLKLMVEPLLKWYSENARVLPWRNDKNPYHIWISEVILQQTRVEVGKKYYEKFIKELPTVFSLASVDEEKLLKLWEGLGYYSRARNLKKAAQLIMNDYQGIFPNTYERLCTLPGIGPYTAGAIASIAYEESVTAIDGNVLRVISRYLTLKENISQPSVKKEIVNSLLPILPVGHVGDFNQALMELGALICLPNGMPKCEQCPLKQNCQANRQNEIMEYPIKNTKKGRKVALKTVLLITYQDTIILEKRENRGLLAGLWGFPMLDGKVPKEDILKLWNRWNSIKLSVVKEVNAKHIFTHIEWHMTGHFICIEQILNHDQWHYIKYHDIIQNYAIPSAFKAFVDVLMKQ